MALPIPFNTVADLVLWSGFEQGASNGQDSVLQGTFAFAQFSTALKESRREIYVRAGKKENADYTEWRADELKESERYLATARLFPNFGSRMQLKFPESNLSSVNSVTTGADTPDPFSKGRQLVEFMYKSLRAIGLELLNSPASRFVAEVSTVRIIDRFPSLLPGVYTTETTCCNPERICCNQ